MKGDKIGRLPKIKSAKEALSEIVEITKDDRGHLLWEDQCDWLELKLKAIRTIARRGLKA